MSSTNIPLAPRAYVIGCLKDTPKAVIKIADHSYLVENPLHAIDILFKIILSMTLEFPRQAISVWNFIERFVYKMSITKNTNTQITTLMKEFQLFIDNNKPQGEP